MLEPDGYPAARPFKAALVEDGIPFTSFAVDDEGGVRPPPCPGRVFTQEPMDAGPVTVAVLDDTCGNLIQIASPH